MPIPALQARGLRLLKIPRGHMEDHRWEREADAAHQAQIPPVPQRLDKRTRRHLWAMGHPPGGRKPAGAVSFSQEQKDFRIQDLDWPQPQRDVPLGGLKTGNSKENVEFQVFGRGAVMRVEPHGGVKALEEEPSELLEEFFQLHEDAAGSQQPGSHHTGKQPPDI